MAGMFIDVQVDDSLRDDADLAARLEESCPVDIYAARDGRLEVVEENLDECVLCELCVRVAPAGKLRVVKLYDPDAPPLEA
jgi:NAD-dependent dihydropyrimidine dehydrogenase PreA subunit